MAVTHKRREYMRAVLFFYHKFGYVDLLYMLRGHASLISASLWYRAVFALRRIG